MGGTEEWGGMSNERITVGEAQIWEVLEADQRTYYEGKLMV